MSQTSKLLAVLQDGLVHTVPELIRRVYGIKKPSSARLAARVCDLRKRGYNIPLAARRKKTVFQYQMIVEKGFVWKKRKSHDATKV